MSAGVDRGEVVVGQRPGQRHVGPGQAPGPPAGRSGEHERERARRAHELGHALARLVVLEPADPEQVAPGQAEPRAHLGDLAHRPGPEDRVGRLADDVDPLGRDAQPLDGVLGHGPRRDDHGVGALDGEVAQPRAHAAQLLGGLLERGEVVQRDDRGRARAQRRVPGPGRVVDVVRARLAALHDVAAGRAQRLDQAARVAPHAPLAGPGPRAEGDTERPIRPGGGKHGREPVTDP